jgi:hypothetical protein
MARSLRVIDDASPHAPTRMRGAMIAVRVSRDRAGAHDAERAKNKPKNGSKWKLLKMLLI